MQLPEILGKKVPVSDNPAPIEHAETDAEE